MQDKYNHLEIEKAAQAHWAARDAYRVVEVMGAAQQAGLSRIGFVAIPSAR